MKHLLLLGLVVLIPSVTSCKYFKHKKTSSRKSDTTAVWEARQDSIRITDSIQNVQTKIQEIENAKLDSARRAEEENLSTQNKLQYKIIVGSFAIHDNAQNLAEAYSKKGYNTQIIQNSATNYELVVVESFDNLSAATARLRELRKTIDPGIWLYVKE
jgi:hypothetical protein